MFVIYHLLCNVCSLLLTVYYVIASAGCLERCVAVDRAGRFARSRRFSLIRPDSSRRWVCEGVHQRGVALRRGKAGHKPDYRGAHSTQIRGAPVACQRPALR
eukprot:5628286-Pyramimonas_sp.AAC.1